MDGKRVAFVAFCLVAPALWGWLVSWLFGRVRLFRREADAANHAERPPRFPETWDYQI